MHFNMLGKQSAADYTQIGHGITDGALQGMDVSQAWKLASDSAVRYTPAAPPPLVCHLCHDSRARGKNLRGSVLNPTQVGERLHGSSWSAESRG